MRFDAAELVGYLASILVVVSLAMTSVVRLRMVSLVGSVVFVVYGLLIGAPRSWAPTSPSPRSICGSLRAELGGRRNLGATVVAADSPFLCDFLRYHLDDIHRFQPSFEVPTDAADVLAMVLMRDGFPAGAFIGRRDGDQLWVELDYVTKPYRDSQISQWLFGKGAAVFRRNGVSRLISRPGTERHAPYLERAGFIRCGDRYELDLAR
ncbi:MAG: hypothetical protein R2694_19275 [Ilumatobacteraceae bacterium]